MDVKKILREKNFKFEKKYGQNFLSDGNLLEAIADKGGVNPNTPVLEIGCGAGTLTKVLCSKAKYVYGYEIDRTLAPVLGENLAGIENCDITFKDIMREKTQEIENRIGEEYLLVANLPYYITTPIIMKLNLHFPTYWEDRLRLQSQAKRVHLKLSSLMMMTLKSF